MNYNKSLLIKNLELPSHIINNLQTVEIESELIETIESSDNTISLKFMLEGIFVEGDWIVPSFCLGTPHYQYQFSASTSSGTTRLSVVGQGDMHYSNEKNCDEIDGDIDTFIIKSKINSIVLELRLKTEINFIYDKTPCLVTLAKKSKNEKNDKSILVDKKVELSVPAKSQMIYAESIRRRICSPTCLSMVVDFMGLKTNPLQLADLSYNIEHDMYGVWSSNIWAISNIGLFGYIAAFSSFKEIIEFLKQGTPVIASINYQKGELRGAPIESTPGHLVVIVGFSGDKILVNDPAASNNQHVYRAYSQKEFSEIWLQRKSVGYIIFDSYKQ